MIEVSGLELLVRVWWSAHDRFMECRGRLGPALATADWEDRRGRRALDTEPLWTGRESGQCCATLECVPKPDLRELARRVFDQSPGDGLGLALDPEAQLDLADVAAERYFTEPSAESLTPWREVVDGVGSAFGASDLDTDLRMRLDTHRLLLAASERWQAGATTGIDGLRACVSRVSEEVLASEPSRAAELIRGLGEFIVSTLLGRQTRTV